MRKDTHTLILIASFSSLLAFAAVPGRAMEQSAPGTSAKASRLPFRDPAVVVMANAISDGDLEMIRTLAPDTDLSAQGQDGVTLLEWAIWNKQPQALATLLEAGADASRPGMDGETVSHMAAMVEPPEYLGVLVEHGAPMDIASPRTGWTPLFRAIESRRDPQIKMLLDAKANVRHVDQMGNTTLHQAAKVGSGKWVLRLLELGIDPKLRNAQDATFQPYYFMTPEKLLNAKAKQERKAVEAWLVAHGIEVENDRVSSQPSPID